MTITPGITTAVVIVTAIAGATVAVCLGHIDSATYATIVAGGLGLGAGAGAHAAGVQQAKQ